MSELKAKLEDRVEFVENTVNNYSDRIESLEAEVTTLKAEIKRLKVSPQSSPIGDTNQYRSRPYIPPATAASKPSPFGRFFHKPEPDGPPTEKQFAAYVKVFGRSPTPEATRRSVWKELHDNQERLKGR
jgi:hypothetical protein